MTTTNPLLAGIRVLDLSRLLPGPYCSMYLAQMGAEVIKIEEPDGGDYARVMPELFEQVNRGKQSITLDLHKAGDVDTFKRLVATADVVLESFRPGVMDSFGCGHETLRHINPRLVYAALTGYGQTGPYRDLAGHDMNYLSIAGALDQIGAAAGPPAQSNVQIADMVGALNCALGILAAVIGARASNVGTMVDVSLTDSAAALNVMPLATLRAFGKTWPRGRDMLTGAAANYAIYRCRGGGYLAVGALEPKFAMRMVKVLVDTLPAWLQRVLKSGKPRGAKPHADAAAGGRKPRVDALVSPDDIRRKTRILGLILKPLLRFRRRDEWARLFAAADACVTPVLTLEEALRNEQLQARGMIDCTDIDGHNSKPAFALPIKFSHASETRGVSPALGADNAAVLAGVS